jgi:EmrB/QacA subfamily drug resistance transporter
MPSGPPSSESGFAAVVPKGARPKYPRLVLTGCVLASSLGFVDGSVVNVGLPAIARSFGGAEGSLQWVINAYLLPLSALLLVGGGLGDRFGSRRILTLGIGLFALGSAWCAGAPSLDWLLVGRAVQGIGAALVLPNSLAILGSTFEGEARGRAIGIWAAVSAISAAIGPVLGGALIDLWSWGAIFLINLPIAAGALTLTLAVIPTYSYTNDQVGLDVLGGILATATLGLSVWGLSIGAGPSGWTSVSLGAIGAAAIIAVAFVSLEGHLGDRALTPLALFSSRELVGLNLMTLLLYGALSGFLLLVPFVLIVGAGYKATTAGAAVLPFPLVMALGGPVMGSLAGRFGARPLLTAGSMIVGLGLLLILRIDSSSGYWWTVFPCVLVVALGMTGAAAPLTTAVISAADRRHTGSASGLNSALSRSGGLIVTALLGPVLASHGQPLIAHLHRAAIAGALISFAAAACAYVGLRDEASTSRDGAANV